MKIDEIVQWYNRDRKASVNGPVANELYFQFHPRTAFLKMLPTDACVADIGAGDGSLSVFRKWPKPLRTDLRLHAYSIEKGEHFDNFQSYEISDWNVSPPKFEGIKFDGIVCAHFIEHISDPTSFAEWAGRKLVKGGRAYVEWPSEASLELPSREELLEAGVPLVISRYHDDSTHSTLPERAKMIDAFEVNNLEIEQQGVVSLPWLEEQLMANFKNSQDAFPTQAAFWSMTRWSQFLVVRRS
jgi:SAM-dependent methyltransferase